MTQPEGGVSVSDARFAQAQNGGADLRLVATDGTQPLIVHEVSMTGT